MNYKLILIIPHILFYLKSDNKDKIDADISVFQKHWGLKVKISSKNLYNFCLVLIKCKEFRNIFYCRVSKIVGKYHCSTILNFLLPQYSYLFIATKSENIGPGFFIEHGISTIIRAKSIGSNFYVNQNVTIGGNGKGIPEIGNNVRISTGVCVLGPIKVGNNCIIGANATILKNVPDNCTVVPSPNFIIKENGETLRKQL